MFGLMVRPAWVVVGTSNLHHRNGSHDLVVQPCPRQLGLKLYRKLYLDLIDYKHPVNNN
jgi:hypothetical protein